MQRSNTPNKQDSPGSTRTSPMGEALRGLTRISARWPRFTLAFVILVTCVCAGYAFFFLRFKTDRAELIDPKTEFHKRWTTYTKTFGESSDVVVAVEAETVDEIKNVVDDLGTRLKREPELFGNVLYKFDSGSLQRKWMQYVRPEELQSGLRRVNAYAPVFRGNWSLIELESVFGRLGRQLDTRLAAASAKPLSSDEMSRLFRHADLLTTSLDHFLANPNDFRSPWPELISLDPQTRSLKEESAYLLSDGGSMGFLRLVPRRDPAEASGDWQALERLREINAEVAASHPGCTIGLTGIPILETDEMRRSQTDLGFAIVIAVVGCLVLLVVGFRGVRHPVLGIVMLAFGVVWALGFTTEMVGHFNIFSLSVVPILIGLGIDFAIVYSLRYLQLRREGWQLRPALMETTGTIGTTSITAAVTAALAFLCMLLTDCVGMSELGIIAAAGILLCALASFIVLPALISLADRNIEANRLPKPLEGNLVRGSLARFPLVTLIVAIAIVIGIGTQIVRFEHGRPASRINFDSSFLNLQAEDGESVQLERRLHEEAADSLLFAVSMADSERQMRELHDRFEALPSVRHVEDLAMRVPGTASNATRQLLAQYRSQLAYLPEKVPALRNADPSAVGKMLEGYYARVKKFGSDRSARHVATTIDGFLNRFEKLTLDQQAQFLNEFQYRMASDLVYHFQTLRYAANDEPIQSTDLPRELLSRYVSAPDAEGHRKWLLQIYPKEKVWDERPLARFVADLRTVDPLITGTPVHNYEAAHQIKHSYEMAALYAFAIIWIVLLLKFLGREARWLALLPPLFVAVLAGVMLHARHVQVDPILFAAAYVVMTGLIAVVLDARNLRDAVIAYVAPMAGLFLMFGLFGLLHVDLNPTNLIVLPLVLGIGVNNSVHVMHDYRSQKGRYQLSSGVFSTVVLTALTSVVGFGSMMIAAHRGLFSLGVVLSIGILSCLFVALVLLPAGLGVISAGESGSASGKGDSAGSKRERESRARAA